MLMDWLKNAPTAVKVSAVVVCGVLALGVLAAYTVLTINGEDTSEFRAWVQTVGQLLVYPFLGVGTAAAIAAANSSARTEKQTNGMLEQRDAQIRDLQATVDLQQPRRPDRPGGPVR